MHEWVKFILANELSSSKMVVTLFFLTGWIVICGNALKSTEPDSLTSKPVHNLIGKKCANSYELMGICKFPWECKTLKSQLKKNLFPNICGYGAMKNVPIICCAYRRANSERRPFEEQGYEKYKQKVQEKRQKRRYRRAVDDLNSHSSVVQGNAERIQDTVPVSIPIHLKTFIINPHPGSYAIKSIRANYLNEDHVEPSLSETSSNTESSKVEQRILISSSEDTHGKSSEKIKDKSKSSYHKSKLEKSNKNPSSKVHSDAEVTAESGKILITKSNEQTYDVVTSERDAKDERISFFSREHHESGQELKRERNRHNAPEKHHKTTTVTSDQNPDSNGREKFSTQSVGSKGKLDFKENQEIKEKQIFKRLREVPIEVQQARLLQANDIKDPIKKSVVDISRNEDIGNGILSKTSQDKTNRLDSSVDSYDHNFKFIDQKFTSDPNDRELHLRNFNEAYDRSSDIEYKYESNGQKLGITRPSHQILSRQQRHTTVGEEYLSDDGDIFRDINFYTLPTMGENNKRFSRLRFHDQNSHPETSSFSGNDRKVSSSHENSSNVSSSYENGSNKTNPDNRSTDSITKYTAPNDQIDSKSNHRPIIHSLQINKYDQEDLPSVFRDKYPPSSRGRDLNTKSEYKARSTDSENVHGQIERESDPKNAYESNDSKFKFELNDRESSTKGKYEQGIPSSDSISRYDQNTPAQDSQSMNEQTDYQTDSINTFKFGDSFQGVRNRYDQSDLVLDSRTKNEPSRQITDSQSKYRPSSDLQQSSHIKEEQIKKQFTSELRDEQVEDKSEAKEKNVYTNRPRHVSTNVEDNYRVANANDNYRPTYAHDNDDQRFIDSYEYSENASRQEKIVPDLGNKYQSTDQSQDLTNKYQQTEFLPGYENSNPQNDHSVNMKIKSQQSESAPNFKSGREQIEFSPAVKKLYQQVDKQADARGGPDQDDHLAVSKNSYLQSDSSYDSRNKYEKDSQLPDLRTGNKPEDRFPVSVNSNEQVERMLGSKSRNEQGLSSLNSKSRYEQNERLSDPWNRYEPKDRTSDHKIQNGQTDSSSGSRFETNQFKADSMNKFVLSDTSHESRNRYQQENDQPASKHQYDESDSDSKFEPISSEQSSQSRTKHPSSEYPLGSIHQHNSADVSSESKSRHHLGDSQNVNKLQPSDLVPDRNNRYHVHANHQKHVFIIRDQGSGKHSPNPTGSVDRNYSSERKRDSPHPNGGDQFSWSASASNAEVSILPGKIEEKRSTETDFDDNPVSRNFYEPRPSMSWYPERDFANFPYTRPRERTTEISNPYVNRPNYFNGNSRENIPNYGRPTTRGYDEVFFPSSTMKEFEIRPSSSERSSTRPVYSGEGAILYPGNTPKTTTDRSSPSRYKPRPTKAPSKPPRVSELKCKEYMKLVTETVAALPLSLGSEPTAVQVQKCMHDGVRLIVGGQKAELDEFPHMAAVGFRNNGRVSWNCGGTLISENYVMTAAHCTHSSLGKPVMVRLGELVLNDDEDGAQPMNVRVERVIVHPDYKEEEKYNDIALLRLERSVSFTKSIRPACLYQQSEISENITVASGWGSTDYGVKKSNALLKVALNVIDNNLCDKLYENKDGRKPESLYRGIVNTMMCAGVLRGGRDTCLGDSGGPLQIHHHENKCIHFVVGVTSFGRFCGQENSPGVYTRVSSFLPWIERMVWGE